MAQTIHLNMCESPTDLYLCRLCFTGIGPCEHDAVTVWYQGITHISRETVFKGNLKYVYVIDINKARMSLLNQNEVKAHQSDFWTTYLGLNTSESQTRQAALTWPGLGAGRKP